ncbi:MAG: hypothetical protein ACI3YM_06520 [Prevotella sp.]
MSLTANAENRRWDFTKWSEATINNLATEAAQYGKGDQTGVTYPSTTLWRSYEKANGKVEQNGNCYWYGTANIGTATANGVEIEELKGLVFNPFNAGSLAIAIDYPSTSLGKYDGGSYLWLGGSSNVMTIPQMKAGAVITMYVESHKPSEGRGIGMKINGTAVSPKEGTEKPTTITKCVWEIPATETTTVDAVFTNNSGCHIYSIEVDESNCAETVSYTVNYLDEQGNQLKEPSVFEALSGKEITASESQTASFKVGDKKYVYSSGNDPITVDKDPSKNVINLVFREAELWTYSFNAVDADGNVLQSNIVSGSAYEGETFDVGFPYLIIVDRTIYTTSKKNKGYYIKDYTLDSNGKTTNLVYSASDKTNIVYLSEAEDIEGLTLADNANTPIRSSRGGSAYAATEDVKITTLNPGKYVLTTVICDTGKNPNSEWNFYAGTENIFKFTATKTNWSEGTSEEFTINEPTDILLGKGGDKGKAVDFVYIQQTGIVEQEVTTETATINFREMTDEPVSSSSSNAGDITEERTFNVGSSTLLVTPSNATTPNRFWSTATGPQLRVYGGYLVVTAPEGKAVTNVSINQGKWNSSNTFNGEASATSEWTGNSTNLMIGIAANTQINSITVTTDAATDATTTYVPTVTSINAVKALPLETEVKFELNSVKTTLWSARAWTMYSYIEDATGAMAADMNISNFLYELIPFGTDIDEGGDVRMEGTLWATRSKDSNGIPTLALSEKTGTDSQVSFTQIEIEPTVAAVATVLKDSANNFRNYLCKYISFSNVTLSKQVVDEYTTNYYIVSGEDSILMYDQYWQLPAIIPDYESIEKIPGFIGFGWDGSFEFHPYGQIEGTQKPAVEVESIGAMKQLDNMSNVTLTLNNAQIKVYAAGWWSSTVYIEDETGGIKVDGTIIDLFPDYFDKAGRTFTGKLNCYYMNEYGARYISVNELTTAQSELTVGEAEVVPTTVTLAEAITAPYEGRLVTIEAPEVKTDEEGYTLFITQGETTVQILDKFNAIPVDDNWNYVLYDKVKSATGLVIESAGEILFLPYGENAFVEDTATGINELQNSNHADQPLFNLRGMKVQNTKGLKGLYIQNGKKVMFK